MKNRKNPCTVVKKDLYQEHVYDDYLNNIEFERVLDNDKSLIECGRYTIHIIIIDSFCSVL